MITNLTNQVVIITGASRGIGAKLAYAFAQEQASVIINYNQSRLEAKKLLRNIMEFNPNCMLVKANISNPKEVVRLCDTVLKKYHKIDVLINNAGICDDNSIDSMTLHQWNRVINTNLTGTFLCTRSVAQVMIEQHYGKIINIASLKGQTGSLNQANYSASKAGIIALTKTAAIDLSTHNISVNAVCPGFVSTNLNMNSPYKEKLAKHSSLLPNKHSIDDLVNSVLLLSSNSIKGITGRIFNLDSRL